MKSVIKISLLIIVILLFSTKEIYSVEYPGGGKVVKIKSASASEKLIAGKHTFQLLLANAVLHKDSGWFFKDKEIIIKVDVKINGVDKKAFISKTAKFTRVYDFEISEYEDGSISIPFANLTLLDWYPTIIRDQYIITGVEIDVEIAKKVEGTSFKHVIDTIAELTQNMNIPMNPYSEAANQLGALTQKLLNDEFFKQNNSEKAKFASIGIRFSPTEGLKSPTWVENDGAFAVVMGRKMDDQNGHVNVLNIGDCQFSYNQNEGLRIIREETEASVLNDHLVFIINSWIMPQFAIAKLSEPLFLDKKLVDRVNSDGSLAKWHIDVGAIRAIEKGTLAMSTPLGIKAMNEWGAAMNKGKIIVRSIEVGLDLKAISPPSGKLLQ